MDFQALTFIAILLLVVSVGYVSGYFAGSIKTRLHKLEQMTHLSLLASLWATTSAESLKKSTIIQRVIEKYSSRPEPEEKQSEIAREMDELLQEFSLGNIPQTDNHGKLVKPAVKPEDLV